MLCEGTRGIRKRTFVVSRSNKLMRKKPKNSCGRESTINREASKIRGVTRRGRRPFGWTSIMEEKRFFTFMVRRRRLR